MKVVQLHARSFSIGSLFLFHSSDRNTWPLYPHCGLLCPISRLWLLAAGDRLLRVLWRNINGAMGCFLQARTGRHSVLFVKQFHLDSGRSCREKRVLGNLSSWLKKFAISSYHYSWLQVVTRT
jgi:hypothetical protein